MRVRVIRLAVPPPQRDKFWQMFGDVNFQSAREPGGGSCFEGGVESFIDAALHGGNGRGSGRGCDTNWIRGSMQGQPQGAERARPLHGPALLGQDRDIYSLCSELSGHPVPPTAWDDDAGPQEYDKLVAACLVAGRNVIRVMDKPEWNMCTNIEWQACLVQGLLPGQTGATPRHNDAQFAVAPKTMTMEELRSPSVFTSPIFYWEVCFFNRVCMNRDELFRVGAGESFSCDFSLARFDELKQILR